MRFDGDYDRLMREMREEMRADYRAQVAPPEPVREPVKPREPPPSKQDRRMASPWYRRMIAMHQDARDMGSFRARLDRERD